MDEMVEAAAAVCCCAPEHTGQTYVSLDLIEAWGLTP
jgi:hypothetical protein